MTPLAVVTGGKRETIADHRRRWLSARARAAELRLAREAGLLVPAREVELRWSAQIVAARTALLGIPSRLKQRCPHVSSSDLAVLDQLIREVLAELATPRAAGNEAAP